MEQGGKRGLQLRRFYDEAINRYAANTGASRDAIRGYWDRRLAVALQRGGARALIQRAHRVACKAIASNKAASHEIESTDQGHAALREAPPTALDPLRDRCWDYTDAAGTGSGCWRASK